ncbi:hypothetical protein ACFX2C_044129 [Malus domestica]
MQTTPASILSSSEEVDSQICFGPQGGSPTGQDLIVDANSFDMGVEVVSDDVSLDPVDSERLRFGDGGEVLIGEVDGDLNVRPRSSLPLHQLQNLHALSDLHHSIRALRLSSKLGSLASDNHECLDLAKASQLHCKILALYNEYDLAGIDVVDFELEWVKETRDKLRMEERMMKGFNQADGGLGCRCFTIWGS